MSIIKKAWLTKPWVIFLSIFLGIIIGSYDKSFAQKVQPIGQMYLTLLSMCILPIMITAVVSSLGQLLRTGMAGRFMARLVIFIMAGLILAGVVGIIACLIAKPGEHLSSAAKYVLSEKVSDNPVDVITQDGDKALINFLLRIVPGNIFQALGQGDNLAILFFSIILGLALGTLKGTGVDETLNVMNTLYRAFLKIVDWVMLGLPIGLCFIFAGFASQINLEEVMALGRLLALIYSCVFILALLCSLVIWRKSKLPYMKAVMALKAPLIVAFGTCSSYATIPSVIKSLEENLRLDRKLVELMIPIGINLFRQGAVLRLTIFAMFAAQLYGQHLSLTQLAIVLVASILAGLAVSGLPGITSTSILAMVLQPLGLPASVGIILMTMVTPIIDPCITLINVYGNCTLAMLVGGAAKQEVAKKLAEAPEEQCIG
jgi:proton glutamate symport protein